MMDYEEVIQLLISCMFASMDELQYDRFMGEMWRAAPREAAKLEAHIESLREGELPEVVDGIRSD